VYPQKSHFTSIKAITAPHSKNKDSHNLFFGMIQCIIGTNLRRYSAIPYFMAYFKLTSAVNAGFIFFQLWYSGNRDAIVITLLVFTGIDIALNLIEMGL
jgi:hypothetical protein